MIGQPRPKPMNSIDVGFEPKLAKALFQHSKHLLTHHYQTFWRVTKLGEMLVCPCTLMQFQRLRRVAYILDSHHAKSAQAHTQVTLHDKHASCLYHLNLSTMRHHHFAYDRQTQYCLIVAAHATPTWDEISILVLVSRLDEITTAANGPEPMRIATRASERLLKDVVSSINADRVCPP
ncbi:MAG TPA: hypothetical protein VH187_13590 [Scandinavium sp.]|jgi:hypothetical protein|uniref:hypothetical protein n=1 Tax=Scandinavium sp. TaxID=2830653 RepID=UPI002E2EF3F9|nr:hypothetical protein [Scandinavium sp.]HEX4502164.1 hypothetical protein [Scandinavium sp.]